MHQTGGIIEHPRRYPNSEMSFHFNDKAFYDPIMQLQNLFMDGHSSSFHVANPSTTYSATVIGGNLINHGDIGNGSIHMDSTNSAKGGDLSVDIPSEAFGMPSMPEMPALLNLDRKRREKSKKDRLTLLLI